MKEQKKEQIQVSEMEGSPILESAVSKKRDTSFVDARKKQIELYGNYYSAGLSDEKLIAWIADERMKLDSFIDNLLGLQAETLDKIESERQAKLAATLAGLSETEKEQLKTMLA